LLTNQWLKTFEDCCKVQRGIKFKKIKYQFEKEYIFSIPDRDDFLIDMCNECSGNTLILFDQIRQYGKDFYEKLKANYSGKVFFVYGDTDGYERQAIRKIVEKEKNAIIVASYGVFSTGVSIKNLHNLIFAETPGKKKIRVIQSIGRLLRKHEHKSVVRLFDIADDLSYKGKANYMITQFMERINLYINEGHEYEILQEKIE
jgi:ERCC4-related helicase